MAHQLLNLRPSQARLITAIAQYRQLQLAASACAMTQPAASRMLAELERQLDMELFTRTPKGMEPTPAGNLLAHHAARITHDLEELATAFDDLRSGHGGSVRVGAVTGPALGLLVPAIQTLKNDTPGVEVLVEVAPSVPLVNALARGDLDFVLARLPAQVDRCEFLIEPARDENVSLLVRDGHPMLERGPVSIGALHGLPWIMQHRGAPIRHAIEAAFNDEGLNTPRDITTTSSLLVIIAMLNDSDAIAPMANEVLDLVLDEPVSANFRRLELNRSVKVEPYLILRSRGRPLPPVAERLLALVRSKIGRFERDRSAVWPKRSSKKARELR